MRSGGARPARALGTRARAQAGLDEEEGRWLLAAWRQRVHFPPPPETSDEAPPANACNTGMWPDFAGVGLGPPAPA